MRIYVAVVLFSTMVVVLQIWGYLSADLTGWGVHHYAFLPISWFWSGVVGAVVLMVLGVSGFFETRSLRVSFPWAGLAVAILGGLLFWYARQEVHFLGDGESRIESLRQARFIWGHEPLGILIPHFLNQILVPKDPVVIFSGLSVFAGTGYLFLAVWFARLVAAPGWGRVLVFGILALAGVTRLFYGFVETTPLLALVIFLYLTLSVSFLKGRGNPWLVAVAGTIPFLVHSSALLLLPSLVYVLLQGKNSTVSAGRRAIPLAIPLVALIAGHLVLRSSGSGIQHLFWAYANSLLPLADASAPSVPYRLFDLAHFGDFFQSQMLLGPFAALIVLLLVLLRAVRFEKKTGFLLLAGIPWWVFSFLSNQTLGAARQWDLFAAASIPFLMVGGMVLAGVSELKQNPRLAGVLTGIVLGVSLFHTVGWVGLGTDGDRSFAHFAALYGPRSEAAPAARSHAFDGLGTFYLGRGQIENAEMAYLEAVTADTTNGYAAGHLGSIYISLGRTREAANILAWARIKNPDQEYLFYELGNALRTLGLPDSAAVAYREALALNPNFLQAYVDLSIVERTEGRFSVADTLLQEALRRFPEDPLALATQGVLEQHKGDTLQAITLYKRVLELNPDDANTTYNLAGALMKQGRFGDAAGYLAITVKLRPRDVEAWINLGISREALGLVVEAISAYQKAIVLDDRRPEPYFNLSRVSLAVGDTARAVALLQRFTLRDSTSEHADFAKRVLQTLGVSP